MKNSYLIIFSAIILSIISCQNNVEPDSQSSSRLNPDEYFQKNKISKEVETLSLENAISVANIYSDNVGLTKSGIRQFKNVVTVTDDNGAPLIYAVNYEDGYILVSATKKYYPVLAQVEEGNFSLEDTGTGADLFLSEYRNDIEYAIDKDTSFVTAEWLPYVDCSSDRIPQTKMDDSYWDVLNEYWEEWADDGCNIYFLREKPEYMPQDMYNRYCVYASDFMGEDSEYMQYAVIVEKYIPNNVSKGPFCLTQWNQTSPYNSMLGNNAYLGCTTIAAGQIMKYFKRPASYNWDAMPNNTSNSTLSSFLKELHDEIGVVNGGATIEKVKKALSGYGYNVKIISHSLTDVHNSLVNNKPVYMRGERSTTGAGHAWVCDGYKYTQPVYEYQLYTVPPGEVPVTRLEFVCKETLYTTQFLTYYRMNWGWGGNYNGYYYDPNLRDYVDYRNNRKDIIFK